MVTISNTDFGANRRNNSLDFVGGCLILYMIYFHACDWGGGGKGLIYSILQYVFFWFMPWFFFKSGMFYRITNNLQLIKSSTNKLIVPFAIFTLVGVSIETMRFVIEGSYSFKWLGYSVFCIFRDGSAHGNYPVWFLLSLFLVKNVANIFFIKGLNPMMMGIFCLILMTFIQIFRQNLSVSPFIYFPSWLYSSLLGIIFYSLGIVMKEKQFNISVFVFAAFVVVLFEKFDFSFVSMNSTKIVQGHQFSWIFASAAFIIVVNNVAKYLPLSLTAPIRYIGKNSMVYLVCHIPIFSIFHIINSTVLSLENGATLVIMYLGISVVVMPLLVRYLNTQHIKMILGK